MENSIFFVVCLLLAGKSMAQPTTDTSGVYHLPSDEEIRQILMARIDTLHKCVGMVVGITTPRGRRLIYYGHPDRGDPRTMDGNTVFEIGSNLKGRKRRELALSLKQH
jgi:D-alanyl-D-alanine-carboxypeptidase/D-alanyl-D-alanine-endopeptidase